MVGSLCLLRIRDAEPVAQLTAKQRAQAVKTARDDQEAILAQEAVSRVRSLARGLEWPLHSAWANLVAIPLHTSFFSFKNNRLELFFDSLTHALVQEGRGFIPA